MSEVFGGELFDPRFPSTPSPITAAKPSSAPDYDLTRDWQANQPKTNRAAFETATNIYVWATAKKNAR